MFFVAMADYRMQPAVSASVLDERRALENMFYVLQHVDKGELEELLNNEEHLNDIIANNEEVKKFKAQREALIASNKNLAVLNLSMEPMLAIKRQSLVDSQQSRALIQAEFIKNREKLESVSKDYSPDTTLALLQTATAQAEEDAEKIVDSFLEGQINVEDFIQEFRSKKTAHHLRRIKSEKLKELLEKRSPSQYSYRF